MLVNLLKYFLILFVCVLFYYVLPKKFRWVSLLIFSFIYYYIMSKSFLLPIIISGLSIYLGGVIINKINDKKIDCDDKELKKKLKKKNKFYKKIVLLIVIFINIGILVYLKYSNFLVHSVNSLFNLNVSEPFEKIILPLGISYYTLMAISYIVDVYRGKYRASNNPIRVMLFIIFFPSVQEGPIHRFDKMDSQLYEGNKFEYKNICTGLLIILWGLFKKIVIADRLGVFVNDTFGVTSGYISLLTVIFYTIELYAEFSGFIDMAIGGAKMFGIDLPANFKRPFFSKTVEEFWRRWHITLGAFLRDYVFYPVSLSKANMKLSKFNNSHFGAFLSKFLASAIPLFFVWFLNGLWHGASEKYIFYGLYYYVIMMIGLLIEPLFRKVPDNKGTNVLKILRTWIFVIIGMTIFKADSITDAFNVLKSIFIENSFSALDFGLTYIDFAIIFIYLIVLFVIGYLEEGNEVFPLNDKVLKYLDMFVDKCKNENIKLEFIWLPSPDSWKVDRTNAAKEYAQKHDIKYNDLNLIYKDLGIDFEKDTADGGDHLNIYGAKKVSKYLGDYLNDNYSFKKHNKKIIKEWNKDYKDYVKAVKDYENGES